MSETIPVRDFLDWTCSGCGDNLLEIEIREVCEERAKYDVIYNVAKDTFEQFRHDGFGIHSCEFTCGECGAALTDDQAAIVSEEL